MQMVDGWVSPQQVSLPYSQVSVVLQLSGRFVSSVGHTSGSFCVPQPSAIKSKEVRKLHPKDVLILKAKPPLTLSATINDTAY
jgi:hypothetical protein